jgi:hypothetical protein
MANPMTYNPAQVMMGWSPRGPYLPMGENQQRDGEGPDQPARPMNPLPAVAPVPAPAPQSNVLGSETVRATGQGPFDPAYRQNLATYAGGLLNRPGGNLNINPTGTDFPEQPSLLSQALGGQAFSYTPTPSPEQQTVLSWQDWLKQFRQKGGLGMRELMQ